MASVSIDKNTRWWSIRYYAGPEAGRVKKTLAKHPTYFPPSKPPKKVPAFVDDLAQKYREIERLAKIGEVQSRDTDLALYLQKYMQAFALTHKAASSNCLKNAAEKFLAWCKEKEVPTVQAVTVRRCDEWLTFRLTEGAERSTVVTERAYLTPIWTQAHKHRLVPDNPWKLAKVPGKPKEESLKYWTVEELKRLFAVCSGWLRDYAILDANTGLRVGALTGLKWKDVDFAGNKIIVPPELSKSGKSYVVPLSVTANAVLAKRSIEAENTNPNTLIFPSAIKKQVIDRGQIWRRLKAAVKDAGINDFGHYPHALRHSFAVALVSEDVPMRLIQELLGHGSMKTTQVYAKVRPERTREVMDRFDISGNPSEPPKGADS